MEVQRVLALARVRHQRHPLVRRLQLLGALDLVGPVKQPHVRELGRQLQQFLNPLHGENLGHQTGEDRAVASMGTQLSPDNARRLLRDADDAQGDLGGQGITVRRVQVPGAGAERSPAGRGWGRGVSGRAKNPFRSEAEERV